MGDSASRGQIWELAAPSVPARAESGAGATFTLPEGRKSPSYQPKKVPKPGTVTPKSHGRSWDPPALRRKMLSLRASVSLVGKKPCSGLQPLPRITPCFLWSFPERFEANTKVFQGGSQWDQGFLWDARAEQLLPHPGHRRSPHSNCVQQKRDVHESRKMTSRGKNTFSHPK